MKSYSAESENYIIWLEKFPSKGVTIRILDKRLFALGEQHVFYHVLVDENGVKCLKPGILSNNPDLDRLVIGMVTKQEILKRNGIYRLSITQEEVFRIADALGFGINARPSIQEVMS